MKRIWSNSVVAALAAFVLLAPISAAAQTGTTGLTLADAMRLISAADKEAASKGYRLSIAVVDGRGDLIALARMPGASPATADTAIGKAMASAMFGQPSGALAPRAGTPLLQGLNDTTGGRLRLFQGALPIVRNGIVVGAMGTSGATAQQDEDVVKAALAAN